MNTIVKLSSHSSFFITLICLLLFFTGSAQTMERYRYEEPKMGSPFQIILYSPDSAGVYKIANKAFKLVDSLNMIFSDYEKESELTKLSKDNGFDKKADELKEDYRNLAKLIDKYRSHIRQGHEAKQSYYKYFTYDMEISRSLDNL